MIAFQQDECLNDKRLANKCNPAGKCEIRRWPLNRSGQADAVWFPDLLTADAAILTIDFAIVLEQANREALPIPNTGIIVTKPDHPTPGFGSRQAMAIIEKLKSVFPDWHVTDWSNVYIELTETCAYVCDFEDATLSSGERIQYNDADFDGRFKRAMDKAKVFGYSRKALS